jgi:hypothetical protein
VPDEGGGLYYFGRSALQLHSEKAKGGSIIAMIFWLKSGLGCVWWGQCQRQQRTRYGAGAGADGEAEGTDQADDAGGREYLDLMRRLAERQQESKQPAIEVQASREG